MTYKYFTEDDLKRMANALPGYSSVAAAITGGLASGAWFVLTGVVLGLSTVKLLVRIP